MHQPCFHSRFFFNLLLVLPSTIYRFRMRKRISFYCHFWLLGIFLLYWLQTLLLAGRNFIFTGLEIFLLIRSTLTLIKRRPIKNESA